MTDSAQAATDNKQQRTHNILRLTEHTPQTHAPSYTLVYAAASHSNVYTLTLTNAIFSLLVEPIGCNS